jgi:hypothetical protein
MLRKASIRYSSDVYALSFEKYKGEFLNKPTTKHKSATENSILKFLTVLSVSSNSIVKGIIDDIINTAGKTAV